MKLTRPDDIAPSRPRAWRWCPFISFEDTNLVGNVYFARHISWQGRCREAFLAEHAPDVLEGLAKDLRLVTLSVSCDYYEELGAFDPVAIEMRLVRRDGHRITLGFDYLLEREEGPRLIARGSQQIACLRLCEDGLVPTEIPQSLDLALSSFGERSA